MNIISRISITIIWQHIHNNHFLLAVKMGRIPKVDKERALQEYRQKIENIPRTQNYIQETNYLKYNSHSNISQMQQGLY